MPPADNALTVDEKRLRRAIDPEIQAKHAVAVVEAQPVGITQALQPAHRLLAIVFVVHPHHPHALLRQAVEKLMLGATGWTPGGPDVEQQRLAVNQRPSVQRLTGGIQRFKAKFRQRFANQRRLEGRRVIAIGVAHQLPEQRGGQRQKQHQRDKQ